MKLFSLSFSDADRIPGRYAFGKIDHASHVALSENCNPQFSWTEAPLGTKSFAIICHDPDVPSNPDDVNVEGRTVPADLPRVDFYHWVLIDLPADTQEIQEGAYSSSVTPRGKAGPKTAGPVRQGLNSYTDWFSGDRDMNGEYFGYDGPCPPWNDERVHRYVFTLFALDVERLPVEGSFTGAQALAALKPHILAEAALTGIYTLNPDLAPTHIGSTSTA